MPHLERTLERAKLLDKMKEMGFSVPKKKLSDRDVIDELFTKDELRTICESHGLKKLSKIPKYRLVELLPQCKGPVTPTSSGRLVDVKTDCQIQDFKVDWGHWGGVILGPDLFHKGSIEVKLFDPSGVYKPIVDVNVDQLRPANLGDRIDASQLQPGDQIEFSLKKQPWLWIEGTVKSQDGVTVEVEVQLCRRPVIKCIEIQGTIFTRRWNPRATAAANVSKEEERTDLVEIDVDNNEKQQSHPRAQISSQSRKRGLEQEYHVYFMCEEDWKHWKVGKSIDTEKRRHGHQTGNPRRIICYKSILCSTAEVQSDLEEQLHSFLGEHQIKGGGTEWFYLPIEKVDEICSRYPTVRIYESPPVEDAKMKKDFVSSFKKALDSWEAEPDLSNKYHRILFTAFSQFCKMNRDDVHVKQSSSIIRWLKFLCQETWERNHYYLGPQNQHWSKLNPTRFDGRLLFEAYCTWCKAKWEENKVEWPDFYETMRQILVNPESTPRGEITLPPPFDLEDLLVLVHSVKK